MPLFNDRENLAESTYQIPNVYSKNPWLKYLGYKENGEMNTWGKISSWVNPIGAIGANYIASNMTNGTDTQGMIRHQQVNNFKKLGTQALIAATIATGGLAGAGAATAGAGLTAGGGVASSAGMATGGAAATSGMAGAGMVKTGSALVKNALSPQMGIDAVSSDLSGSQDTDEYYNELGNKKKVKI